MSETLKGTQSSIFCLFYFHFIYVLKFTYNEMHFFVCTVLCVNRHHQDTITALLSNKFPILINLSHIHNHWHHWSIFYSYNFAFSSMSYKWDHTAESLLILISFTYHVDFLFFYCHISSLFIFISGNILLYECTIVYFAR